MVSLRERLARWSASVFPWVWRLAILALPWQTRWFQEGPQIAGYPWEQGRISIYASWIVMLGVVGLDRLMHRPETPSLAKKNRWLWIGLALFCVFTLVTTAVFRSTLQWWLEVLVLLMFARSLLRRVTLHDFVLWVSLSVIPHTLLGIWQAFDQRVIGYSILGMASQNPLTPGVSVIETGSVRWLRAYGGFSHPNIFGGWLVLAILSVYTSLKSTLHAGWKQAWRYGALALFSVALIFTYSRSAWLALCVGLGMILLGIVFSKTSDRKRSLIGFIPVALIILVSVAAAVTFRPQLVFSRAQVTTRLEQKSVSERKQGIENALRILRDRPITGSGLGASAWVTQELDQAEGRPNIIPVPPHVAPLLGLAELGILGTSIGLFLLYAVWRRFRTSAIVGTGSCRIWSVVPCLFLIPIVLLDHYLWSYWSGKTLLFITALLLLKQLRDLDGK